MSSPYRDEGCRRCGARGFPSLELDVAGDKHYFCQACTPKDAVVPWVQEYVMQGSNEVLFRQTVELYVRVPWYVPPPRVRKPWHLGDAWYERLFQWLRNLVKQRKADDGQSS